MLIKCQYTNLFDRAYLNVLRVVDIKWEEVGPSRKSGNKTARNLESKKSKKWDNR